MTWCFPDLSRSFQIFPDLSRWALHLLISASSSHRSLSRALEWPTALHSNRLSSESELTPREVAICPDAKAHMRSITGSVAGVGRMMLWGLGWPCRMCWTCLYIAYCISVHQRQTRSNNTSRVSWVCSNSCGFTAFGLGSATTFSTHPARKSISLAEIVSIVMNESQAEAADWNRVFLQYQRHIFQTTGILMILMKHRLHRNIKMSFINSSSSNLWRSLARLCCLLKTRRAKYARIGFVSMSASTLWHADQNVNMKCVCLKHQVMWA